MIKQESSPDELFRVGATRYGDTTLTILGNGGMSVTLTLNQTSCEQMIRMLRATYIEDTPTEEE